MALSFETAVERVAQLAPSLDYPTRFIEWAEVVVDVLSAIYSVDYDDTTTMLYDAAKEYQDYESED